MSPLIAQPAPLEVLSRLFLATILGAAIGMERESTRRPAGLRTHTLVSIGSALFTLLSIFMAWWGSGDFREPGRIAAQVVSGIGFLGAGTIMRSQSGIRGLTTAATLWSVAGIGMAAGAGYYFGAVATTAFVYLCLRLLRRVERKVDFLVQDRVLTLECRERETISKVSQLLKEYQMELIESSMTYDTDKLHLRFVVRFPEKIDYQKIMIDFIEIGVLKYQWDDL